MSLILEALKKSEAERRLGEAPRLGAVPGWAPPRRRSMMWWLLLPLGVVAIGAGWSNRDLIRGAPAEPDAVATAPRPAPKVPPLVLTVDDPAQVSPAAAPAAPIVAQQDFGPPAAHARRDGPTPTSARPMPDPVAAPQSMDDLDAMKDVSPENQRRVRDGELFVPNPGLLAERGPTTETQIVSADAVLPPPLPEPDAVMSRDERAAREQAEFAESLRAQREQLASMPPVPASPAAPPVANTAVPPPSPPTDSGIVAAPPASAPVAAPVIAPAAPADPAAPAVLSIHDLTLGQRQGLPPLKMSVHFYNRDVARRFVIVDGQRLNEGGVLGQELWAREIRPEGVVMEYRNIRFLLPRVGG